MKIVYCISSLDNPGGMERVLTTKVNYLADNFGYEIYILTMQQKGMPFFDLSHQIVCHNMNVTSRANHKQKLEQWLFQLRPDITVSLYGPEFTFLYKLKDGSKKIVEFHFTKYYLTHLINGIAHLPLRPLHRLKAWLLQKREERDAPKYDKVVLLTQQDLALWGNRSNMCYIHNPLSFRSDEISTLENNQIIGIGRFIAQKGFDLLLDAFHLIAADFPSWKIVIYGEGQDKQLLEKKIETYKLGQQVLLHAPIKRVEEAFMGSSIFVFPSRYEGFGLVLTEAMECGLPCIAFDCECGPREIIAQNETGFLVSNKNAIELANNMRTLMKNKMLRKQMGKRGKEFVAQFHTETIMQQWHQLFTEL